MTDCGEPFFEYELASLTNCQVNPREAQAIVVHGSELREMDADDLANVP